MILSIRLHWVALSGLLLMGTFWGHPLKVFPSPIWELRFLCRALCSKIGVLNPRFLKSSLLIGFRLTNNWPKLKVDAFSVSPNCLGCKVFCSFHFHKQDFGIMEEMMFQPPIFFGVWVSGKWYWELLIAFHKFRNAWEFKVYYLIKFVCTPFIDSFSSLWA